MGEKIDAAEDVAGKEEENKKQATVMTMVTILMSWKVVAVADAEDEE